MPCRVDRKNQGQPQLTMFNWQITLNSKQVLILLAFDSAMPDERGNQFATAHSMVVDAWTHRGVRHMLEDGLLQVDHSRKPWSIWTITPKGRLIAEAIRSDADTLKQLKDRNGVETNRAVAATPKTGTAGLTVEQLRKKSSSDEDNGSNHE